jgi:hypothetical protein
MLRRQSKILCGTVLSGLIAWSGYAADFRLSFLETESVLDDTCTLLKHTGVADKAVQTFRKVVIAHNKSGNRVDRTQFPPLQKGYYHFASFNDFTNRTACGFSETPGNDSLEQHTLMCFDVASLLLAASGCDAPALEQDFSDKGFVTITQEDRVTAASLGDFQNAAGILFPANGYESLIGEPRSTIENRIGISIRARRVLPPGDGASDKYLKSVFTRHVQDMKRDGFLFPKDWRLGLGLVVNTNRGFVWGDHSFICIQKQGRFICIEKNGPKGPYVRAEFKSEKDVARYMSWDLLLDVSNPQTRNAGSPILISLNEQLIEAFRPATSN